MNIESKWTPEKEKQLHDKKNINVNGISKLIQKQETIKHIKIRYITKDDKLVLKTPKYIQLNGVRNKLIDVIYTYMRFKSKKSLCTYSNYKYNTNMFSIGGRSSNDVHNVYFPGLIIIGMNSYQIPIESYSLNFRSTSECYKIICDDQPLIINDDLDKNNKVELTEMDIYLTIMY